MSTYEEGVERMKAAVAAQPLRALADSLALLDAMPKLDDAHRLTRAVLIDVIVERCPEADAAFEAWAESDDLNMRNGSRAIVDAVRALSTRGRR